MGKEFDNFNASKILVTIRIGVTGHRILEKKNEIKYSVQAELRKLDEIVNMELPYCPHVFVVISPLAEGADRLVAQEILDLPQTDKNRVPILEAILPMPEEDYIRDFTAPNSLNEYYDLKSNAHTIKTLDYNGIRADGFESVGRYVVQSCDILFVIWNGKVSEKRGGTYNIFEYAKEVGCPYVLINSNTGLVQEENIDKDKIFKLLKYLD